MSTPTEQTKSQDRYDARVRVPRATASAIPASSEIGTKVPLRPPVAVEAPTTARLIAFIIRYTPSREPGLPGETPVNMRRASPKLARGRPAASRSSVDAGEKSMELP